MVFTCSAKCVFSRKYPYPPTPWWVMETQRGGGVQRESISEAVGVASQVFFPGAPSKIDEQAQLSVILPLIGVSKQKLLLSLMIFYLRSAGCFFHGLLWCGWGGGGLWIFFGTTQCQKISENNKFINNVEIFTTRLQRDLTYSNSPNLQGNLCPVSSRLSRIILPDILRQNFHIVTLIISQKRKVAQNAIRCQEKTLNSKGWLRKSLFLRS